MIRMRGDGPHCGNRRRRAFRRLDGTMDIPEHGAAAPTKRAATAQTCSRTSWASNVGNSRRTASSRTTLSSMGSSSGWTRQRARNPAVRDVLWNLLEHAQLDAKQRKLIWPDAERLDLEQSIQRVQTKYPDFPRDEVEEFLLNWVDSYDPENYSQAQLDELDSLTERWVADHLRMAKASKKQKRTRHS